MAIQITKHPDGYTAIVTPPHSEAKWTTPRPMDERLLRTALGKLGCHMIDVSDAFAAADPEIAREYEEARHRLLVERVGEEEAMRIEKETEEHIRNWEEYYRGSRNDFQA